MTLYGQWSYNIQDSLKNNSLRPEESTCPYLQVHTLANLPLNQGTTVVSESVSISSTTTTALLLSHAFCLFAPCMAHCVTATKATST